MPSTFLAASALVLYLLLLWLAFGARSLRHRRATGDPGLRWTSERAGSPGWWGGLLFAVAMLLGLLGPVLSLTGLVPAPGTRAIVVALGAVAVLAGAGVVLWSQAAMGRSWRVGVDPDERTDLVTGGPFARVRNPIFTGMFLAAAGFALLVPTWVMLAFVVALVAGLQLQVRHVEEPYLLSVHGSAYRRYAAGAGRFVPGLGRLPA